MSEFTTQFDVHPNQIKQWKDQLLDGLTDVFDDKPQASKEPEIDVKSLHAKIGQLTLEDDFYEEVFVNRRADGPSLGSYAAFPCLGSGRIDCCVMIMRGRPHQLISGSSITVDHNLAFTRTDRGRVDTFCQRSKDTPIVDTTRVIPPSGLWPET